MLAHSFGRPAASMAWPLCREGETQMSSSKEAALGSFTARHGPGLEQCRGS